MRVQGLRISARGYLGLVILFLVRDPIALGVAALLLWHGARRFLPGLWSASVAAFLPAVLWGPAAAALCFLSGILGVLIAGHTSWPAQGAWSQVRDEAADLRRRLIDATRPADRLRIMAALIPPLPPRRIRPGAEIVGWSLVVIAFICVFAPSGARGFSADVPTHYVAEIPSGRVILDRAGRTTLEGPAGGIIVEHDGRIVRVIQSACAEHRCEGQSIKQGGIICVPNRILIRPVSGAESTSGSRSEERRLHSWTG